MAGVGRVVRRAIEEYRLLAYGDTVVVGVSGGPDSLCLLHILFHLSGDYGLTLHVAHLHHGLRGHEADADAQFVHSLATEWRLPCTVEQADVPTLAREQRLAVEEAARRARYAFLGRVARDHKAPVIAVGHNADDQAETVLMHWLRGAGLAGLRGMLPSTPLAGYRLLDLDDTEEPVPNVRLVRPLLEVTRAEIETHCRVHGLQPRFDRSNLDTTYFRNWLRHEVIPLLSRHNPSTQAVMRRSARVMRDEYALLRNLLEKTWPAVAVEDTAYLIAFDLEGWRALPVALQRSTLREAVHRLRSTLRDITFVHVENALHVARDGVTGQQATLPQHLRLTVTYDRIVLADVGEAPFQPDWPLLEARVEAVPVNVPGFTTIPGSSWALEIEVLPQDDLPAGWEEHQDPWLEYIDAGAAGPRLWLRSRQPGDRFQPLGMGGRSVKLGGFLTNQKVPQALRDRLPLLANEQHILWVCGQRLDERARVRENTHRVLLLRLVRVPST